MTQTPALTGSSVAGSTAPTALFNPRTFDASGFDEETRRVLLATIEWFEAARQGRAEAAPPRPHLVRRLPRVHRARARLRDAADARVRGRRRRGQALGHRAHLRVQRDHRLLRARLLVHVAGHDPRPRADLAEREPRGARPRGRTARRRGDLRVRPVRADPRRRHLLDRHDPHARRRGRLRRERRQVLHRQRQPRGHGVRVRPPRRRRGAGRLRLLRRRQPGADVRADQERRERADVRERVPPARPPGLRRRRPAHRPRGVRRGAQHGERRQVQPRLRVDRDRRARVLRGDHARARARALRPAR